MGCGSSSPKSPDCSVTSCQESYSARAIKPCVGCCECGNVPKVDFGGAAMNSTVSPLNGGNAPSDSKNCDGNKQTWVSSGCGNLVYPTCLANGGGHACNLSSNSNRKDNVSPGAAALASNIRIVVTEGSSCDMRSPNTQQERDAGPLGGSKEGPLSAPMTPLTANALRQLQHSLGCGDDDDR